MNVPIPRILSTFPRVTLLPLHIKLRSLLSEEKRHPFQPKPRSPTIFNEKNTLNRLHPQRTQPSLSLKHISARINKHNILHSVPLKDTDSHNYESLLRNRRLLQPTLLIHPLPLRSRPSGFACGVLVRRLCTRASS